MVIIMKDFKNFSQQGDENFSDMAEKIAAEYKGKSENDVIKSIMSQAEKGKRAGTLTDADIDNFYNNFSPMLNAAQKKKLKVLIEKLKKIPPDNG